MRYQPNSILGKNDGIYQLSALIGLRALLPRFWDRDCEGPFVLTLTDLHQSNFFVDDDWNITRLIDLEFAPVRPIQMVRVPSWLNSRSIDELNGPYLEEYKALYTKFVDIVEKEETASQQVIGTTLSQRLRDDWNTGRIWYTRALDSTNGFPFVFEQHLQPRFFKNFQLDTDGLALMQLWDENVLDFIAKKLKDKDRYQEQICEIFAAAQASDIENKGAVGMEGEGDTEDGVKADVKRTVNEETVSV